MVTEHTSDLIQIIGIFHPSCPLGYWVGGGCYKSQGGDMRMWFSGAIS